MICPTYCDQCGHPVDDYIGMVEAAETLQGFICEDCWDAYLERERLDAWRRGE